MKTTQVPFRGKHLQTYNNENNGATAILFVHGNSGSSKTWERQFQGVLNDKYHLIAYDIFGLGDSGRSDTPESDYSISALTESIPKVVNEYNLTDYFLVGHSLGGHVIVQALEHLPGCKGIVSIGAPPISLPPQIDQIYLPTAPVGVMFQKDYDREDVQRVKQNFFHGDAPDFFESDFDRADGMTRQAIGAILGSDEFKDEVNVLTHNAVPKMFINGANERSINNDYYETLDLPATWSTKIHRIPGAAHYPHWENAEAVNELIDRFVSEHR